MSSGQYTWPLFGSDFMYEDFRVHTADEYRIEVLGSDPVEGEPCRVLRLRPLAGPYKMMLVWLSTERPVVLRTDYFDEEGLWKRYTANPEEIVRNFDWWVPMHDEMLDLRTGRRTVRRIRNILVDSDVPDELFTLRSPNRSRRRVTARSIDSPSRCNSASPSRKWLSSSARTSCFSADHRRVPPTTLSIRSHKTWGNWLSGMSPSMVWITPKCFTAMNALGPADSLKPRRCREVHS